MTSIELKDIKKNYGSYIALKGISLFIESGEFIVIVGPSGCGKSTLLKTIAGLEDISSGNIFIGEKDVTKEEPSERGIAMVFQSYALYPHMTVEENMSFGLRLAKRPKAEIDAAVKRSAAILKLEQQLDKLPKQLSGGQRQRVAIGRAITRSPDVFLFDEPLSNLDAALRTQMRVELSTLHSELKSTMIYVTHDQVEAMTMADRIVVLNDGEIEQVGSPLELYINPKNKFVAGFLGAPRMNFFKAEVVDINGDYVGVKTENDMAITIETNKETELKPGQFVTIGVRPEAFGVSNKSQEIEFAANVKLTEHLGRETILYADAGALRTFDSDTGTTNVTIQLSDIINIDANEKTTFGCENAAVYLFDVNGNTISKSK